MENIELRNKQKQEAIERLKILQEEFMVHKNVLKEFKQNETIYYSENLGGAFSGILYWLHNKEEFVKKVKEIEKTRNLYIYHCILNHYRDIGDVLTMLYVSEDESFWEYEREELKEGYAGAYVWNISFEPYSEFGNIGIDGVNGGLVRRY